MMLSTNLSKVLVTTLWPQERMVNKSLSSSGGRTSQALHAVESSSTSCKEDLQGPGVASFSPVEVVKRLVHKVGVLKVVAEIIASDIQGSTACVYW